DRPLWSLRLYLLADVEAGEQLHVAFETAHAGHLRAMLLFARRKLRPPPVELVARILLVGGAGSRRGIHHSRGPAAACLDIEMRNAAGGATRSSRLLARGRAGGFRRLVGFGNSCAGGDERAALPSAAATCRFPFRRKRRRRMSGAAICAQHDLVGVARDRAAARTALGLHDAKRPRCARPRGSAWLRAGPGGACRTLRRGWSLRPGWSGHAGCALRPDVALGAGRPRWTRITFRARRAIAAAGQAQYQCRDGQNTRYAHDLPLSFRTA